MPPISGKTLIGLGIFVLFVALSTTMWECHTYSSQTFTTLAFLEMVCPAGRLDPYPEIPLHTGLFSRLTTVWVLGSATLVAGMFFCWLESPSRQTRQIQDFEPSDASTESVWLPPPHSGTIMTITPVRSGASFGKKAPAAPQELAEGGQVASEFPAQSLDLDDFKAFVVANLRPDRLLGSLREQRARRPDYGYCNIVFRRFSNTEAAEIHLDDFILRANASEDVRAAVSRISEYGFQIQIGTYDEPSGRDLQVGIMQDDEAEISMRTYEGLD